MMALSAVKASCLAFKASLSFCWAARIFSYIDTGEISGKDYGQGGQIGLTSISLLASKHSCLLWR